MIIKRVNSIRIDLPYWGPESRKLKHLTAYFTFSVFINGQGKMRVNAHDEKKWNPEVAMDRAWW